MSRRSVRESTVCSRSQESLEASAPTGAAESITNRGADSLVSHLTSQISTLLSSFSDQLVEEPASLHIKGEQEDVGTPSSLLGDSRLPANHAEKVQEKTEQLSQGLNNNVADMAQPIMQNRLSVTPDGWISELIVPSPTLCP
ncbi:hypothetical protein TTRE_0000757101 [Trichuris trichiura]|uniref:Uncharacterized protein n=1 Tax=Trichuris trichiura TaxID=36087 RepID=A0A077ZKX0_TRITR|nr:hypothetical protein TTRE_0000757101 [Trichuris trichiura]